MFEKENARGRRLLRTGGRLIVVLGSVGVLTFGLWLGLRRTEAGLIGEREPASSSQLQQQLGKEYFHHRPAVMVVSDSIGGGVGDPAVTRNYPQIIADTLGWDLLIDAVGARGFLPTDLTYAGVNKIVAPFIDHLPKDSTEFKADYIVVDGGRNDFGKNPADVEPAIANYMVQLRKDFPDAKIVIVLPSYITPIVADNYPPIADQLRKSADEIGAYVLDPVGDGWFTDIDLSKLWWKDKIHLNNEGCEYYAQKIIEGFEKWGFVAKTETAQGAP